MCFQPGSYERMFTMRAQTTCWIIAMKIFGLSLLIRRNRAEMGRLIKRGGPYTSPRLINLDRATAQLGNRIHKLLAAWERVQPKARIDPFPIPQAQEERSA